MLCTNSWAVEFSASHLLKICRHPPQTFGTLRVHTECDGIQKALRWGHVKYAAQEVLLLINPFEVMMSTLRFRGSKIMQDRISAG